MRLQARDVDTACMSTRHATLLAALAAVWGGSYLLIKYALDGFCAAMIVSLRGLLASAVLFAVLRSQGLAGATLRDLRERPKWALILAMTAVAAPFLLITFGEHVVPSGLTAVLISPASLFVALLAPFLLPSEKIDRRQAAGMLLGLAGVALVVGVESVHSLEGVPGRAGDDRRGVLLRPLRLRREGPLRQARRGPDLVDQRHDRGDDHPADRHRDHARATRRPPARSPASSSLGAIGTAIAFVIYYELINGIGPARAALVSYLAPGVALFYGAIFLDEAITVAAVGGLVLILGGVAIASRPKRVPRRSRAPAAATAA